MQNLILSTAGEFFSSFSSEILREIDFWFNFNFS